MLGCCFKRVVLFRGVGMKISDFIDFDEIYNDIGLNESYDDYELWHEECEIQIVEGEFTIILVTTQSNGLCSNDPSFQGSKITLTLDENLEVITEDYENT